MYPFISYKLYTRMIPLILYNVYTRMYPLILYNIYIYIYIYIYIRVYALMRYTTSRTQEDTDKKHTFCFFLF